MHYLFCFLAPTDSTFERPTFIFSDTGIVVAVLADKVAHNVSAPLFRNLRVARHLSRN